MTCPSKRWSSPRPSRLSDASQRPLFGALAIPAHARRVDIASDLHLSPELPRTCAAFFSWLQHSPADALIILGDLFEAWVGDDGLTARFEAECAQALRDAAQRRPVAIMRGNRDFLLGPAFFSDTGCTELSDPCVATGLGTQVLLSHGDALCLADVDYQAFRAQVRTPAWQQAFLAQPLDQRLQLAAQMRAESRRRQAQLAPESYADPDPALCAQWLQAAQCNVLIHGHTHRPGRSVDPAGWERIVLSDWDLDHAQRCEVLAWTAAGFERLDPRG